MGSGTEELVAPCSPSLKTLAWEQKTKVFCRSHLPAQVEPVVPRPGERREGTLSFSLTVFPHVKTAEMATQKLCVAFVVLFAPVSVAIFMLSLPSLCFVKWLLGECLFNPFCSTTFLEERGVARCGGGGLLYGCINKMT